MLTNKKGSVLLAIIFIIIILIVLAGLKVQIDIIDDKISYCQEQGWKGIEQKGLEYHCYKEIPHKSGTGHNTIYSGAI